MVCCAIAGCTNHSRQVNKLGIKFHIFPKKSETKQKWINACKRADKFSVENARVCSIHFTDSDYERDLKSELLNIPSKCKLKTDAVPTLNLPSSGAGIGFSNERNDRDVRAQKRRYRQEGIIQKTAQGEHRSSVCGVTVVKHEPVEAVPLTFPKQEMELLSVKEEPLDWEVPDGHVNTQEPLNAVKEACSPSDDCLGPRTLNTGKTEDDEDEEAMSEDDFVVVKHEVESVGSDSEQESALPVGMENIKHNDDSSSLVSNVSLGAGTGNRIQCTTKEDTPFGNKSDTVHVGHRRGICKKTFAQLQEMKKHAHLERRELLHLCGICHKTFTMSSSLKRHFLLHTGERPYVCGICSKTFTQSYHLKLHSRLHSGERPYVCSVCNKSFIQNSDMKRHLLLHTDIHPYKCDVCHKSFIQNSELTQHLLLHTDERPYRCVVCKKTFDQNTELKEHLRVHIDECTYSCGICNKTFMRNSQLKRHSQLHTNKTAKSVKRVIRDSRASAS
ncbi:zinc finger protein 271-like isoform X1 [Schistocerca americana]|uniref:zinc finger protein 271-like isoform X1 n=1 Tax=Schistocerca americana TaxID=7009 RepID=UPI001F4FE622|nr:zinc finger protein 271-like isoform X1 [Schistocerca americana]